MLKHHLGSFLLVCLPLWAVAADPAVGQETLTEVASPSLPWNHWAVRAAERLDALGLTTEWLPAQREVPLTLVAAVLGQGAREAVTRSPELAGLASSWLRRLHEEWPGLVSSPETVRWLGGSASAGYSARNREGPGEESRAPAALAVAPSFTRGRVALLAAGNAGAHVAALLVPQLDGTELRMSRAELVAGFGALRLSVGRTSIRYGYAESGAVVFSGVSPLDRLEFSTARPVRLPWVFSALGQVAVDGFLSRLDEARHPYHPFLAGFSLQIRPHSRLVLAVQRGVMFGGTRWRGRDLGDVLGAALGTRNGSENNVAAFAVKYRAPTEGWLPANIRLEWGGDDNGGAWLQVPGLVAGVSIPALPRLPEVSVGAEFAYLGRWFRRDITWYSHGNYTGGWASGQSPLGHQLGGNGRECRVYADATLLDTRLQLHGAVFTRQRFSGNLYGPSWIGTSRGGELEVGFHIWPVEFELVGAYENSETWSAGSMVVTAKLHY